jgi:hypothetical protein
VTRDQWRHRIAQGDQVRYEEIVAEERKTSQFKDKCGRGAEPGFVLYVETNAKGFKRRQLLVRAALYDADTRRRAEGVDEEFRVLASVPIDAPTARSVQQIWLWEPGVSRRYFARVQIYEPQEAIELSHHLRPPAGHRRTPSAVRSTTGGRWHEGQGAASAPSWWVRRTLATTMHRVRTYDSRH